MKKLILTLFSLVVSLSSYSQTPYLGSSYNQVMDVIMNGFPKEAEFQEELLVYQRGELPHYQVNRSTFFQVGKNLILDAAKRTTTESFDFYPRLTKLVHANGVCVSGQWTMTEDLPYTGYFSKGKSALFIGRVSVALSNTERGYLRGFGLAGKLFPTSDPNEKIKTANFFTADDLGGTTITHFTETAVTNEPALSIRFTFLKLLLAINSAFTQADSNPGFRPLYPISELGLKEGQKAITPHWMKIEPEKSTVKIDEDDFRNELNFSKYYPEGMKLSVYVSELTPSRFATKEWTKVGFIKLNQSYVSYGCDRQLHFAHPKLK